MEDLSDIPIIFIYCNKEKNIARIETNNIVKEVKQIKEEQYNNYISILYKIMIPYNYKGKPFALTLIDKKGNLYFKYVYSTEKFNYEMIFEPFYKDEPISLNQQILSYKEQFLIFKKNIENLKDDDIELNDLLLDSIKILNKGKIQKNDYTFLYFLFIEIIKEYKNNQNDLVKNTIKKFLKN